MVNPKPIRHISSYKLVKIVKGTEVQWKTFLGLCWGALFRMEPRFIAGGCLVDILRDHQRTIDWGCIVCRRCRALI